MKQMWDKKILVKLIEDETKITVDDALSDTSKNPVQNKVIYTALSGKQDSLPDTTEQEGKFLGVDENGDLAWANAGGSKKYLHTIKVQNFGYAYVVSTSNTEINSVSAFATFLYDNNYRASNALLTANLASYLECSGATFTLKRIYGFYSENGTTLSRLSNTNKITATTDGSTVSFSIQNDNVSESVSSMFQVTDFVQEL